MAAMCRRTGMNMPKFQTRPPARFRVALLGAAMLALTAPAAQALTVTPTYDATITGSANVGVLEGAITTAIGAIEALYADAGTVAIYFGTAPIGGGQSNTGIYSLSYGTYKGALQADAAANPANTVLSTAIAHLGSGNDANGAQDIAATSALLRVGLHLAGNSPCFNAVGAFVNGCNSVNDGVVTIDPGLSPNGQGGGLNSTMVTVLEHEIDEVLGGGGTGTTLSVASNSLAGFTGVTDLYRYHATGDTCGSITSTPSFTTSADEVACYSIDGGATSLVQMNQSGIGDFGDFTNSVAIQNFSIPNSQVGNYSTLSPEFTMMQSIGWDGVNAVAVPEPSSMLLLGSGVLLTRVFVRRKTRR